MRDHILAFDPAKIDLLSPVYFSNWATYVGAVQKLVSNSNNVTQSELLIFVQNFGDGQGGSVYRQQLNLIVRHYMCVYPGSHLDTLARHHEISGIQKQIKFESGNMTAKEEHQQTQKSFTSVSKSFRRKCKVRKAEARKNAAWSTAAAT